jgi:hypothetical protein
MPSETIYDEFCPWPFWQPYGLVERPIVKPKKPRKPRARAATKALFTSALFKPKVIPNKKRKNTRGKVRVEE